MLETESWQPPGSLKEQTEVVVLTEVDLMERKYMQEYD